MLRKKTCLKEITNKYDNVFFQTHINIDVEFEEYKFASSYKLLMEL